jgi:uncharacterized protein with HEPN domain
VRADQDWLQDIVDSIAHIRDFIVDGREAFLLDLKTQRAVTCELEIIGEATKNLSTALKTSHPDIPWKQMAATRDRLIHGYFSISPRVVWRIASVHLQKLPPRLRAIADSLEK